MTDITERPTSEGKLYCCAIKDVFSNRIVGYSIDDRMTAVSALRAGIARRQPDGVGDAAIAASASSPPSSTNSPSPLTPPTPTPPARQDHSQPPSTAPAAGRSLQPTRGSAVRSLGRARGLVPDASVAGLWPLDDRHLNASSISVKNRTCILD